MNSSVKDSMKGFNRDLNTANGVNGPSELGFKSFQPASDSAAAPVGSNSAVPVEGSAARMNVNKDKLTAGAPRESTDKKLVNGSKRSFKQPINSPIGLGQSFATAAKAPIHHYRLSNLVAANISRLAEFK